MLVNSIIPLAGFIISLWSFKCTSCLAYLPSSIAFIAVVYVTSQFEIPDVFGFLAPVNVYRILLASSSISSLRFISTLTFHQHDPTAISDNATFITQVGLLYILFLSPALIAAFLFSCSRPVSAAVLGAAIAATAISFGAFGISNVFAGVLGGIAGTSL